MNDCVRLGSAVRATRAGKAAYPNEAHGAVTAHVNVKVSVVYEL